MDTINLPPVALVSGPRANIDAVLLGLRSAGFHPEVIYDHGFPSYTDPITAHAAGKPNSGHTPDTLHPETLTFLNEEGEHEERENPLTEHVGSAYEDDPDVEFIACIADHPDGVQQAAESNGWQLRAYTAPTTHQAVDVLTREERIARVEADLAIIKKGA